MKKLNLLPILLALATIMGCSMAGPSTISHGRADYNAAINRTNDEQLLLALVRGRYGETSSLLAVTGVAANVRFSANYSAEYGISKEDGFEWSLVPFKGGVAYEENPTISYAPVQGERYLRQIMSPVPLDILILALRSSIRPTEVFTLLVKSVNGIKNPDFLKPGAGKSDQQFQRLVAIFEQLAEANILYWVRDQREDIGISAVIRDYDPEYTGKVLALLGLLGLSPPGDRGEDIVLPVFFALKGKGLDGIAIATRSTMDLIEIMRAAVDVPEDHIQSGIAQTYPPLGLAGKGVHIRVAVEKPANVSVRVPYDGYWFYIDRADQRAKMAFRTLRTLWEISIASASADQPAPVLTLPVSR